MFCFSLWTTDLRRSHYMCHGPLQRYTVQHFIFRINIPAHLCTITYMAEAFSEPIYLPIYAPWPSHILLKHRYVIERIPKTVSHGPFYEVYNRPQRASGRDAGLCITRCHPIPGQYLGYYSGVMEIKYSWWSSCRLDRYCRYIVSYGVIDAVDILSAGAV